jgi:hypothetical protein
MVAVLLTANDRPTIAHSAVSPEAINESEAEKLSEREFTRASLRAEAR